jgi:ssRNA-specific RNase YbeY (16S rRNA maturation enzyme)
MARTRYRSTAVVLQSYKRPSDQLLQKLTNVLQTPKSPIASGEEVESNEVVAKKKCVNKEQRKDLSSKVHVTLTHGILHYI